MNELIKILGTIAAEAEKVRNMAHEALTSIPKEEFDIKKVDTKDGKVYKDGKFIGNIKKLQSVQDFCKSNRCWAAMDEQGGWHLFYGKPFCHNGDWKEKSKTSIKGLQWGFPDVDYDKSLIAPDGRLILIEGKKQKKHKAAKFKAGKWYKNKKTGAMIKCEGISSDFLAIYISINGQSVLFDYDDASDWYEMKHYNPDKKKKEVFKRGEPIFVWDDPCSDKVPAIIRYVHSFDPSAGAGVWAFDTMTYGGRGAYYRRYRKYDPELVGVPRKDWPKE